LTKSQQFSIGAVVVCNERTETLRAFGIALENGRGLDAERLSYQHESLPPRSEQSVCVEQ